MRYVRKFYFVNAAGERVDLNGAGGLYAVEPSGLGVQLAPVMSDAGWGFFSVLSGVAVPQAACGFTLVFTRRDTAYADYYALARWIAAAGDGLRLIYSPMPDREYYRSVSLSRLSKTELTQTGWLRVSVELRALTPWYLPTPLDVPVIDHSATAYRMDLGRFDLARYDISVSGTFLALLPPGGDIPAAIRFRYTGAISNPTLTLTGQDTGKIYGEITVAASFAAGDTLEWSSDYLTSGVRKIAADGTVTDLTDALDPAADNFPRLPLTEACALSLDVLGTPGAALAEVDYYYSTV